VKQCGSLQKNYETYKDKIDFFWVYSQEARSSDTGLSNSKDTSPLKDIKNHRTLEQRKLAATHCAKETSTTIPLLLDNLDHTVTIRYHGHPTRLFIIDKNSNIAYAGKQGPFKTNLKAFTQALETQYKTVK